MEPIAVTLPTGFAFENKWHRTGWLRPLNGMDEELIHDLGPGMLPVERTTLLLRRCVKKLGPKTNLSNDDIRNLTVGDRDALLLHLRRLTFGDTLQAVLICPQTGCGEKMDLELCVGDLLIAPNEQAREIYEIVMNDHEGVYRIRFRLPTGADQEAVVHQAYHHPETATNLILRRCLQEIYRNGVLLPLEQPVPDIVAAAVSQKMAELDSQAEIALNVTCPVCHSGFIAHFDIGTYFFKELTRAVQTLFREVAVLALYYHWSERELVRMTRAKRQTYLTLLTEGLHPEQLQ